MSDPSYRLVRPARVATPAPVLDDAQRRVVDHPGGPLLVLAGPGTGKTTTLVEAVVDRVAGRGVPIENILVLTFGRRAAGDLRDRITARLNMTVREPLARTFHSYAFGLLRLAADPELPTPRLLSGAEQDVMLRDLVAGDLSEGRSPWPASLLPALGTRGFAAELRDLLLRAAERGLDAGDLDRYARELKRPEWHAAAVFLQQYSEVTALARPGSYDAAELIRAATRALESDPALLLRERERRRHIFVDEYQDTDPAQAELLALVAGGADELVLVGDPDQSIYAFRGADPLAMRQAPDRFAAAGRTVPTVALLTSRRAGRVLLDASRRVAAGLTAPYAHRALVPAAGTPDGQVGVALVRSPTEEAALVAAALRRAHLEDEVPWSRMAVVVRSTATSLAVLRRAMITAGVPVGVAPGDVPLAEQSAVSHLLTALRCVLRLSDGSDDRGSADPGGDEGGGSDGERGGDGADGGRSDRLTDLDAELLLLGPIGGADAMYLRRLRRVVHTADPVTAGADSGPDLAVPTDALGAAIADPLGAALLPGRVRGPVLRVARTLAAGVAVHRTGASAEDVLWAIWEATGLGPMWERASAAGGASGAAADRDLDSVIELFATAARLADRLPGATADVFYEHVAAQQVPGDVWSTSAPVADAVQIVTAHGSKGMEWDVVCVAGVQEGVWPDLRRRGSLLGSEILVDVAAGNAAVADLGLAHLMAEERRLFYVAVTRARRSLLVTAVQGEDEQPSRFLDELDPLEGDRPVLRPGRGLHLPGIVAELRAVVTDESADRELRHEAAAQLARLSDAGVPGAHPDSWWGLADLSDDRGLLDPDQPAGVSPSKIDAYLTCALKTFLEGHGAGDSDSAKAALGSAVHQIAEVAGVAADLHDFELMMDQQWTGLDFGAVWFNRTQRRRATVMLERLATWLTSSRDGLSLLAREQPFEATLGDVVLRGTVDRLEVDTAGRPVVIDFKTSGTKVPGDELAEHPQLAAYQLAVELGAFAGLADGAGGPPMTGEPGGAVLVQLGASGPIEQRQGPLAQSPSPDRIRDQVDQVGQLVRGARFDATANRRCRTCSVRRVCPVEVGAQVTE